MKTKGNPNCLSPEPWPVDWLHQNPFMSWLTAWGWVFASFPSGLGALGVYIQLTPNKYLTYLGWKRSLGCDPKDMGSNPASGTSRFCDLEHNGSFQGLGFLMKLGQVWPSC